MDNAITYKQRIRVSNPNGGKSQVFFIPIPKRIYKQLPQDLWAFYSVIIKTDSETFDIGDRRLSRSSNRDYVSIPLKTAKEKNLVKGMSADITLRWKGAMNSPPLCVRCGKEAYTGVIANPEYWRRGGVVCMKCYKELVE